MCVPIDKTRRQVARRTVDGLNTAASDAVSISASCLWGLLRNSCKTLETMFGEHIDTASGSSSVLRETREGMAQRWEGYQ